MNNTKNILVVAAIILLAGIGGFAYRYFAQPQTGNSGTQTTAVNSPSVSETSSAPQKTNPSAPTQTRQQETAITYNNGGFFPQSITVKKGATVVFKNESSFEFWPASAVHPVHAVYDGTSLEQHCPNPSGTAFDACAPVQPGSSWSFKFDKIGSWGYHDHLNPGNYGKVTVQ